MQAVTFQAPGEVRLEERPEPELIERDDAIVRVEATGVCGSDLHIYHGRVEIEPGFTLGHEFVGTVVQAGERGTPGAGGRRRAPGGRGRPRAGLLLLGLRQVLLLPPRPVPQVRRGPRVRPRQGA